MGVFTAGVLEALNERLRDRVRAIYGTSSGADVGVYFLSDQTGLTLRFFIEHLTQPGFLSKNLPLYLLKVFFFKNNPHIRIPDYVNVDYVVESAKSSDCRLDLAKVESSDIEFYVKVIDIRNGSARYLPAKADVFQKLMATSQCGPFSTRAVTIDGVPYIDGSTIVSGLDAELVRTDKETLYIGVQPTKENKLWKAVLYPFHLLASLVIGILYGGHLGKSYVQGLFVDPYERIAEFDNVLLIKNELSYSAFCTNKKNLERVYRHGVQQARMALAQVA